MRLLIIGHNYAPEMTGIGPYTTELAEHFAAQGHSVSVLTTFPHYPRYRWQGKPRFFKRDRAAGVDIRRMRVILPRRPGALWRIIFDSSVGFASLLSSVGVERPSLVIAVVPTLQSGLAGCILARGWRVPSVLLVKDLPLEASLAVGMLKPGLVHGTGALFERIVYRLASRIVVIGEEFRDNLLAKGVRNKSIKIIPDWVDLELVKPLRPETAVRRRLAGCDVGFLLLHAGAMAEKQGLSIAVDASEVLAEDPTIRTVLVGDGPKRAEIEAAIRDRHLANIRVLDIQPAYFLPRMLAAADVLLLTQRVGVIEAVVPSKLLHYMAAGRPVIAAVNASSVAARLITEAGCGVVIPPEAHLRLADAIRHLKAHPELGKHLGRRGREYARKRFSKADSLDRWDRFIAEMLRSESAEVVA